MNRRSAVAASIALVVGSAASNAIAQVVESSPFLGVKLYSITQTLPRPLNIRLIEIDLTQADLRFRMSPRDPGLPNGDETIELIIEQQGNDWKIVEARPDLLP